MMKFVVLSALICGVMSGNFLIKTEDGGCAGTNMCLTAIGTVSEPMSLVMTHTCSDTDESQQWTYDHTQRICSVSVGKCLRLYAPIFDDINATNAAIVLGTGDYDSSTEMWPVLEVIYDPALKTLYVPGNCKRVLAAQQGAHMVFMYNDNSACSKEGPEGNSCIMWNFIPV
jgi:hypothetical protein